MSSNSSKVLKRYSNRPQCPQKFINVLNSSVGNQVRKDPRCPEKSLNSAKGSGPQKFHKKSSKGPENSSMLWDPQVRRSSKSPQKVHKVHKRSRKCTKGPQRPQPSGPLMFLKLLKRSSKSSKSSKVHKRYSRRPQIPQQFINVLNSSVGNQVRKDPQCPEESLKYSKASGPQ